MVGCCLWVVVLRGADVVLTALEPFFSAAASQFVLGQSISLPLWLSLTPIVLGK